MGIRMAMKTHSFSGSLIRERSETRVNSQVAPLNSARAAFTLIELLVVIAIMAILAALVLPVGGAVKRARIRSVTKTEMQKISQAITSYKDKHNVYPPDNPNNIMSPLYYELVGTTLSNNTTYVTRDGKSSIPTTTVPAAFGPNIGGFINCTKGAGGDEGIIAQSFLREVKPNQVAEVSGVKVLVGSVGWPAGRPNPPLPPTDRIPWQYVANNPTNNPRSYDLWIDVVIGSKTNRICNWSEKPIVL